MREVLRLAKASDAFTLEAIIRRSREDPRNVSPIKGTLRSVIAVDIKKANQSEVCEIHSFHEDLKSQNPGHDPEANLGYGNDSFLQACIAQLI